MMTYSRRLSAKVAAAAVVTVSASWLLFSPAPGAEEAADAKSAAETRAVGPHTPEYGGPARPGVVGDLVRSLSGGAVVIVLNPAPDGTIKTYAIDRPGSELHVWVDGRYQGPGNPSPPPQSKIYGEGNLTDITIWEGSGCCIETKLNGKPITVCSC